MTQSTHYLKGGVFTFNEPDWKTPNTYCTNFALPPKQPGVYLLVKIDFNESEKKFIYTILYVGSSQNLLIRYNKHEIFRTLKEAYGNVVFYFQEEHKYLEIEKELIKIIQPKFNTQHK